MECSSMDIVKPEHVDEDKLKMYRAVVRSTASAYPISTADIKINTEYVPEILVFRDFGIPAVFIVAIDKDIVLTTPAQVIACLIYSFGFKFIKIVESKMTPKLFEEVCNELAKYGGVFVKISTLLGKPYVTRTCIMILLISGALFDVPSTDEELLILAIVGNPANILFNPISEATVCEYVKSCEVTSFYKLCAMHHVSQKIVDTFFASRSEVVPPIQLKPFIEPYRGDITYYETTDNEEDENLYAPWLDLGLNASSALRFCIYLRSGNSIIRSLRVLSEIEIGNAIYNYFLSVLYFGASEYFSLHCGKLYDIFDEATVNGVIYKMWNGTAEDTYEGLEEDSFVDVPTGASMPAAWISAITILYGFRISKALL